MSAPLLTSAWQAPVYPVSTLLSLLPPCLLQFPSEEEASIELDITPEALAAKNEKVGHHWHSIALQFM
jgi:hypothetical protein